MLVFEKKIDFVLMTMRNMVKFWLVTSWCLQYPMPYSFQVHTGAPT